MRKSQVFILVFIFSLIFITGLENFKAEITLNSSKNRLLTSNSKNIKNSLVNRDAKSDIIKQEGIFSNLSLSVKLDEALSVIEGNLTVVYLNNDPITLDSIPFHLYPSGMQFKSREGDILIFNVTTTGSPSIDLPYKVFSDQQLMWVNLSSPLEFNQSTSLRIVFNTTLPDGQDRANSYGFDSNRSRMFTCTAFYPIPCVYDKYDGWNIDPYLSIGDPFYFDMAYYDLMVEVPTGMIVAATGELIYSSTDGITTKNYYNPHYPVREVVFSASRYFQVESTIIGDNSINVSSYYLPHSTGSWAEHTLDIAVNSLLLFMNSYGSYPYATYNLVEAYGFYSGMEYPCQVQISESIQDQHPDAPEFYQELIIAHETAHQWWCQLVGNDQIDWGHLDEGLTSWSTDYYFDFYYPDWNFFEQYWPLNIVRTYYEDNKQASIINQSIYDFLYTNMSYRYTAYTKSPLILQKLRLTIGPENFLAGLKDFFQEHHFKIATFPDLQKSFEKILGKSLDWYFYPWFDNPFLPKYSFKHVEYNSALGSMSVAIEDLNEDKNEYPYSQQLFIRVTDIQELFNYYYQQVWINGTTILNFELTAKGNPALVFLLYESDVLVQLKSAEQTVLVYKTWYKAQLIEFIELSVVFLTFCVVLGYIIWIVKKK
ncbi:MAG: M1 family metallopeptidase [Promethearchaeota archaeon]